MQDASQSSIDDPPTRVVTTGAHHPRAATALLEVAEALQAIGDAAEIARRAAREVTHLVGADSAVYFALDDTRQHVHAVAGYRLPKEVRHTHYRIATTAVPEAVREASRRGQSLASSGLAADGRFDSPMVRELSLQPKSVLCAPAITDGLVCGALVACWWHVTHEPTAEETRIATAIGGLVALAVEERRRRVAMSAAGVAIAAPNRALFIVARHNRHLYDALRRTFADDETVDIVLDRRETARRQDPADVTAEGKPRELDRRQLVEVDSQLRRRGWAVVTLRPRP